MASSSGNSNSLGSTLIQNSGSEEGLHQLMDQRKRKRMESNRESARRSRMRKQKHLDDLVAQMTQLGKDNDQILTSINFTTQHYLNIEAENSVLRAQMTELSQRLDSLNEILNYLSSPTTNNGVYEIEGFETSPDSFINPFNLPYFNQTIMASADIFQY
ncbi:bZIP transcription factor 44-like [Durio zibethinus]|uniref:BZIP transcription factor 44-like n=1 Tax=Durio zibethinus TaxID=66656 RepID=A0A6P6B4T1_DURZI|nr:bZIP transcription factor 44-like [Durio zibethinus]